MPTSTSSTGKKAVEEKCGIVGVYTKSYSRILTLALTASQGVQHRGQQGSGVVIKTHKGLLSYKGNGTLATVLTSKIISRLNSPGRWVLVHCRYGTYGGYNKSNLQPCTVRTDGKETISVVHNGEFAATDNYRKIISHANGKNISSGASDTYLFTAALAKIKGRDWDQKIVDFLSQARGAYSLMIAVDNSLYLARDIFGIKPLILGEIKGGWLAASETHAFNKVGAKIIREIRNGEIVKLTSSGLTVLNKKNNHTAHFCDFEWAYFSRPDSLYPPYKTATSYKEPKKWLSVTSFRERSGEILAREAPLPTATFVVGVPDSGISLGTGYANALKLPYRQVIIRDHFDQNGNDRLFMRDDQMKLISKKVLGKLSLVADPRIWKDANVVVADDSIVRGNVSSQITSAIFSLGARQVHWIIGFPPIKYTCHLGISIRTDVELIAASSNGDAQKVARKLKATSVHYISPQGLIQARLGKRKIKNSANPREIFLLNGGCAGCVTGLYPVSRSGHYYFNKNNGSMGANQLPPKR